MENILNTLAHDYKTVVWELTCRRLRLPQVVNWPEVWIIWTVLTPPWITPSLVLFLITLLLENDICHWPPGLQQSPRHGLGNPQVWLVLLIRDKGHLWGRTVTEPSVSSKVCSGGNCCLALVHLSCHQGSSSLVLCSWCLGPWLWWKWQRWGLGWSGEVMIRIEAAHTVRSVYEWQLLHSRCGTECLFMLHMTLNILGKDPGDNRGSVPLLLGLRKNLLSGLVSFFWREA